MAEDLGELQDPQARLAVMLYHHIQEQIELADTKAQFILAANAILEATLTTVHWGMALKVTKLDISVAVRLASLFQVFMFVALIGSFYYALMVAKPSLAEVSKDDENLYYFGGIQTFDAEEFSNKFVSLTPEQIRSGILIQVYTISHIAFMKFTRIRKSINFLVTALGLWAAAHIFLGFAPS